VTITQVVPNSPLAYARSADLFITFSQDVTSFSIGDLTVSAGILQNFTVLSPKLYRVTVSVPDGNGLHCAIKLEANRVKGANNSPNLASNSITLKFRRDIFFPGLSNGEVLTIRDTFLQRAISPANTHGQRHVNSFYHAFHSQGTFPHSTIIHGYNYWQGSMYVHFTVKFPEELSRFLPANIRTVLTNAGVEHLDISFTPQYYQTGPGALVGDALKPHYWVFERSSQYPQGIPAAFPDGTTIPNTIYNKNLLVGVFADPSFAMTGTGTRVLAWETLHSINVHLHDRTLSPNVGHLGEPGVLDPFPSMFWSLAIEPDTHRAGVTLHVLTDPAAPQLAGVWHERQLVMVLGSSPATLLDLFNHASLRPTIPSLRNFLQLGP
jgi:hypothetical protein